MEIILDTEIINKNWKQRYINRLISHGYEKKFAVETCKAAEIDLETEPESAADDEVSY